MEHSKQSNGKRVRLLLIFILLCACHIIHAQDWTIIVTGYIADSDSDCTRSTTNSITVNGFTDSSPDGDEPVSVTLTGSFADLPSRLNINTQGHCFKDAIGTDFSLDLSTAVDLAITDIHSCQQYSYYYHQLFGFTYYVGGSVYYFTGPPGFGTPSVSGDSCYGPLNVSVPVTCAGGLQWYYFNNNIGYYVPIPNKTTHAISLTDSDFGGYGDFTIMAVESNYPFRQSAGVLASIRHRVPDVTVNPVKARCSDTTDGGFRITASGSDPQYLVSIYLNSAPTNSTPVISRSIARDSPGDFVGLLPETQYRVEVSADTEDVLICTTTVSNKSFEKTDPITISFTKSDFGPYGVSCHDGPNSSNGFLTAHPSGGEGGFDSYSWSKGATPIPGSAAILGGISEGTYTVNLMDANHCPAHASDFLLAPPPLTISLAVTSSYRSNPQYAVSCAGATDGEITITSGGGVGARNYTWSTGEHDFPKLGGRGANTPYYVTVTDGNACTMQSDAIMLDQPAPISFDFHQVSVLHCSDDKTMLEVSNVQNTFGNVNFAWTTGDNDFFIDDVGAADYRVTVSDDKCSTEDHYAIIAPPATTVSIEKHLPAFFHGTAISCTGANDGTLEAVVKDHLGNTINAENYTWLREGAFFDAGPSLSVLEDLDAAEYTVGIVYNTTCTATGTLILDDPEPVAVQVDTTFGYHGLHLSCNGAEDGSLTAVALGGTGMPVDYDYQWNGHTGSTFPGVKAGHYSIEVKDLNGCIGTGSFDVIDPDPVHAQIISTSDYHGFGVSCFGIADGMIASSGEGGTGNYTYSWSSGTQTTNSLTGLAAGSYTVTVTDENGCHNFIEQTITMPDELSLAVANKKDISCHDGENGEIDLNVMGGAGQFEYSINSGTDWQPEHLFSSLTATHFSFIVRDANLCTAITSAALTEPDKLEISFTDILPAFCANPIGTATAVVTGGVERYSYQWSMIGNPSLGTQSTLSDIPAGIYDLSVEDAHHCMATSQVPITSTDGAKSIWEEVPANCFDTADGSAVITITEGDGPFTIAWPDGQNQLQGNGLKKGNYFVSIKDGHDCSVVEAITITAPDPIVMTVKSMSIPSCNGFADGAIELEASGGTAGYSFEWNGRTVSVQNDLKAGVYPIRVTDAHHCILNQSVELLQPDPLRVNVINSKLATCKDGCDGALQVAGSGGNGDYVFLWNNGNTENLMTNICPGNYPIRITDRKNCSADETVILINTPPPPLDLGGGVTLCVGQTYVLDAGNTWKTYSWKGANGLSSNQQQIVIKEAGEYVLETTTKDGCIAKDTFLLETSLDLLKASFLLPHEADAGDTVVFIDISWPVPESATWDFPDAMLTILDMKEIVLGQFNTQGVYNIGLTATLGECRDYISKSITILNDANTELGGRLGYEEQVKTFEMYPNPTDGNFEVGVELAEAAPIILSIWNSTTGVMMKRVSLNGASLYKAAFDLRPLGFGTYVIRLDHQEGKKYLRFVVH